MVNNIGSISINKKRTKESQPSFRGKATINGKKYYISGWPRKNDYGEYISLSFELANYEAQNMIKEAPIVTEEESENIPF